MKHTILLAFFLISIASCNRHFVTGVQTTNNHTDTVTVEVVERIDTVTLPGDTIEVQVWLECDTFGIIQEVKEEKQGKRSSAKVRVDNFGKLVASFTCEEYRQAIISKDSLIQHLKTHVREIKETVTQQVVFIPASYKWAMGWAWFSFLILFLLLGWQVARLFKLF